MLCSVLPSWLQILMRVMFLLPRAYCLCRIFTEMAESFLYYTVHQPNTELGDLQIYCTLLMCIGHSDYEVGASLQHPHAHIIPVTCIQTLPSTCAYHTSGLYRCFLPVYTRCHLILAGSRYHFQCLVSTVRRTVQIKR